MYAWAFVLFVLGIGVVSGLSALTSMLNPRRREETTRRFAAAAGVRLTPELAADVTRRLLWRDCFDMAGRVAAVIVLLLPGSWLGFGRTLLALVALLGGARLVAQLTEVRRAAARGARVTHLVPPRLTDYLQPMAVACVRTVALLPVGLAVLRFAGPTRRALAPTESLLSRRADDRSALGFAAVAAGTLLLAEVAARLVLRLRRVAGTPAELALDDAFRVSALRDLAVLPLLVGVAGSFWVGALLGEPQLPWAGIGAVTLTAVGIGAEATRAHAWRRRLHPELAARQPVPVADPDPGDGPPADPQLSPR